MIVDSIRTLVRSKNPVLFDGHNLPPSLVEIGLTDLQKSGGAMAPPAPPGSTGLYIEQARGQKKNLNPFEQVI